MPEAEPEASAAPETAAEEPPGPFQAGEIQSTQKNLTRGLETAPKTFLPEVVGTPASRHSLCQRVRPELSDLTRPPIGQCGVGHGRRDLTPTTSAP